MPVRARIVLGILAKHRIERALDAGVAAGELAHERTPAPRERLYFIARRIFVEPHRSLHAGDDGRPFLFDGVDALGSEFLAALLDRVHLFGCEDIFP